MQVNTSGEDNKGGIEIGEAPKLAEFIRKECQNLKFDGFMTIGSFDNRYIFIYCYDYPTKKLFSGR